jgi:hypothetical protein
MSTGAAGAVFVEDESKSLARPVSELVRTKLD